MMATATGAAGKHDEADDIVASYYCRDEDENDEDDGKGFFIV